MRSIGYVEGAFPTSTHPMSSWIIETTNLTKIYSALRQFAQAMLKKERYLGWEDPTIKMLTTHASITSGEAKVAGYDVAKQPAEVRKRIGVVLQELTADDELK